MNIDISEGYENALADMIVKGRDAEFIKNAFRQIPFLTRAVLDEDEQLSIMFDIAVMERASTMIDAMQEAE